MKVRQLFREQHLTMSYSCKCSPSVELQSAISTDGEHLCGWCVSDVGPGPPIQCWGSKRVFARAGSRGESVSYGSACLCLRGHHRSYPFGSIHFFSKGWDFTRAAELLKQPLEGGRLWVDLRRSRYHCVHRSENWTQHRRSG